MNPRILNRDFQHPADGWYQLEAVGEHPHHGTGLVQVIDEAACQSIVRHFNADAAAGTLRHGRELLIDHEHFSDQSDQETRAYGWLQELQHRLDGIYGRIRWTSTGQAAVDGG
ncbi:MAG TPA: phage protease, partial [Candidatus Acidoferrales bacterium]|nr:phage protease [Candidatus Acidoferrales bacterium]